MMMHPAWVALLLFHAAEPLRAPMSGDDIIAAVEVGQVIQINELVEWQHIHNNKVNNKTTVVLYSEKHCSLAAAAIRDWRMAAAESYSNLIFAHVELSSAPQVLLNSIAHQLQGVVDLEDALNKPLVTFIKKVNTGATPAKMSSAELSHMSYTYTCTCPYFQWEKKGFF